MAVSWTSSCREKGDGRTLKLVLADVDEGGGVDDRGGEVVDHRGRARPEGRRRKGRQETGFASLRRAALGGGCDVRSVTAGISVVVVMWFFFFFCDGEISRWGWGGGIPSRYLRRWDMGGRCGGSVREEVLPRKPQPM